MSDHPSDARERVADASDPGSVEYPTAEIVPPGEKVGLPVPVRPAPLPAPLTAEPRRTPARWRRWLLLLVLLAGSAGGGVYWWRHAPPGLPPGIVAGNGRIEADEIDIATKFAGRIAELRADEGDLVKAEQALARMDTRDLEASLGKAKAQAEQAQRTLDQARADLVQQQAQLTLARQEMDRSRYLLQRGVAGQQAVDQRQAQLDGAAAAVKSITARIGQAEQALEAAKQDVALFQVNIADNTLIAPRDGRIQYRLANVGEVLGAGGKVFTLLDVASVYMDVFLPTADAGRAVLGAEARIVLDALPDRPIPARVTFVADQAQFTPKAVETRSERDKLMFRLRVRVDPALLRAHPERVRSGLPGVAYIKLDTAAGWPPALQAKAPE